MIAQLIFEYKPPLNTLQYQLKVLKNSSFEIYPGIGSYDCILMANVFLPTFFEYLFAFLTIFQHSWNISRTFCLFLTILEKGFGANYFQ